MIKRRTKKNTPAVKLAAHRLQSAEMALAGIDKQIAGWRAQEASADAVLQRAKASIRKLAKRRRPVLAAVTAARKDVKSAGKGLS